MPSPRKELFSAKPYLNHEGECLLQIGETDPLHIWQVSRKALEPLFFADYD
jgi:hypothetical protein